MKTIPGTDWGNEEIEGRGPVESMKDTVVERSSRLLVDCGLSVRTPGKENRGVALMPVNTPQKLGTGTPYYMIQEFKEKVGKVSTFLSEIKRIAK